MDLGYIQYSVLKNVPEVTSIKVLEKDSAYTVICALINQTPEAKNILDIVLRIYSMFYLNSDTKINIDWYYMSFINKNKTNLYLIAFSGEHIEAYVNNEITDEQLLATIEVISLTGEETKNE